MSEYMSWKKGEESGDEQSPQTDDKPSSREQSLTRWAGYSEETMSDKELLDELGIEGNTIPSWFKSNVGKAFYKEVVSLDELLKALSYLEEVGMTKSP